MLFIPYILQVAQTLINGHMLCFPNAKINIGLNVICRRSDGYHDIETVFYPIGLSDILEIIPLAGVPPGTYKFTATGIPVDAPSESNLCVKAYQLLCRNFQLPATDIHLHKIIPLGAGLGGGSSDAAFMLKYLSQLFGLGLDEGQLCDYASELGSDCAFFIKNRPLFGYGRGNRFRDIAHFPGSLVLVLVNPGIHVSTAEAYAGVKPGKPDQPLEDLIRLPFQQWRVNIVNDFERHVISRHPRIGEIKELLYRQGAIYASMSGSGSSVYGLFNETTPELEDQFPGCFFWSGQLE